MLPDGADKHLEDWTIFFLNQTPFNKIAPVLALESHSESSEEGSKSSEEGSNLLYVLNLVRTNRSETARRCVCIAYLSSFNDITQ